MTRPARLAAAPAFLESYTGPHVIRAYRRWFGVDTRCALLELALLGAHVDPARARRMLDSAEANARARRERREAPERSRSTDAPGFGLDDCADWECWELEVRDLDDDIPF